MTGQGREPGSERSPQEKLAARMVLYRETLEGVCQQRGITVAHRVPHWSDPLRRSGRSMRHVGSGL